MVRTNCSVYGCQSSWKSQDIKFHRFPSDERREFWIEACQRPDLKSKTVERLYNMHVCGLHFEKWMYIKTKLKSSAIPVANLPPASLYHISTQTETTKIENRGVQQQIDASVGVSVVASTNAHESQTTEELTDHTPRKRKLRTTSYAEDATSTDVTYEQFLRGCDKFLSPNLSKIVKAQANLKRITHYNVP